MARWPHILQIQTIPVDERTTIGVVDLRTCLQAIAQCSPEIVNQHESDYTVYAYDFSEPDLPLVGQGMLSWGLEHNNGDQQQQQLVTGRVTRSLLAILSNGSRETLEVKLKLTPVPRIQRLGFSGIDSFGLLTSDPIPTDGLSSEWNSFIQSNPTLGHSVHVTSMNSPAMPPAQLGKPMNENRFSETKHEPHYHHQPARPASIPPPNAPPATSAPPSSIVTTAHPGQRPMGPLVQAPSPAVPQVPEVGIDKQVRPSSRPASRASRKRAPTGRPRGRPPKKASDTGNTSAAEEATDGDEGPQKKRAKVVRTEYSPIAPFGSVPDSLRVAASTSGSLRTMRPVAPSGDVPMANHVQDVPRAPTPVPNMGDMPLMQKQPRRMILESKSKQDFDAENMGGYRSRFSQPLMQRSMSHDTQSPESTAQSPDAGYTPEESPGDLGSSPPVPRTSAYLNSSPPASSPVLPPMRQVDSGFMSGGIDDYFDDDELMQELPLDQAQDLPGPMRPQARVQSLPPTSKSNNRKGRRDSQPQQLPPNPPFAFQEVNPGPPELLPTKSIFNPAGKAKVLNRPPASASAPLASKKPASRSLKRANTAPNLGPSEQDPASQEVPTQQPLPDVPQLPVLQPEVKEQSPALNISQQPPNDVATSKQPQPEPPLPEPVQSETVQAETNTPSVASTLAPALPRVESVAPIPVPPTSRPASRHDSAGPKPLPVPASDPVNSESSIALPLPFLSEAPQPPSDAVEQPRYNKNQIKKQSIKVRLEAAIQKGEMPPFCNNCGAIETPTWRKIWTQDHRGVPGFHELSEKPGSVTMIDVLERDQGGQPSLYQLVKKSLAPTDDKKTWTETLLCNPCGIWLGKFKSHRPRDRWDKDAGRLNQARKRRETKGGNTRSKKTRTKSDAQMNPTSEAYFNTDPIGPADQEPRTEAPQEPEAQSRRQSIVAEDNSHERSQNQDNLILNSRSSPKQRGPGSTHSRGSGTADSPIAVDDNLGSTRRLLFPSPRKDGVPKVLGELTAKAVQTASNSVQPKQTAANSGKENHKVEMKRPTTPTLGDNDELEQELFGTPPARPSTPPPKSNPSSGHGGPFKTPTRPTPSHRPITRSISRSIRTVRSVPKSPAQVFMHLQRTPSRTPRSSAAAGTASTSVLLSAGKRRSPRHAQQQSLHAHFSPDEEHHQTAPFDSPFTATIHQLLSEANEFTSGSPSHGLLDVDLGSLPNLDQHLGDAASIDFGNYLSTDLPMPSSPPLLRSQVASLNASLENNDMLWAQLTAGEKVEVEVVSLVEGGDEPN